MKLRKLGVVLLALLLAGMAMVPMVSAADPNTVATITDNTSDSIAGLDEIVAENYIPLETARENAIIKMFEFTDKDLLDDTWNNATVSQEPLIIYDINGKKLFYQFTVEKNGKKIGEILSSADKVLGIAVKQLSEPSNYNLADSKMQAKKVTEKTFPGFSVQSTKVVCYSYPDMGVMVHIINAKTNEQRDIIYDANSLLIVHQERTSRDGEIYARSYYSDIPESAYKENIAHWEQEDTQVNQIMDSAKSKNASIDKIMSEKESPSLNTAASYPSGCTDTYCELPKGFPTIDQGQLQWCQVATAWVITKYYYPANTRTLANIASTMQADPVTGATWSNELAYYPKNYQGGAASGGLGKVNSYYRTTNPSLTYETIRTEILLQHPLKVGYNGHSRACIGYSRNPGGDTYYKFSNSQGDVPQWEAAPNPYGSLTGYQDYIIVE
jgi:hypothetical protein